MEQGKRALGRGLSALISDATLSLIKSGNTDGNFNSIKPNSIIELELTYIEPNPEQPRQHINPDELAELAKSIAIHGILQPILVRKHDNNLYQIIAGERRWRAAKIAGLKNVPVIIKDLDSKTLFEIAIIENIQRSALQPLEEAIAYNKLLLHFQYTQENLAIRLGKSRSHITNTLRLLKLPEGVRDMLAQGEISAGHARALIGHSDPLALARRIINEGLSVREIELFVKENQQYNIEVSKRQKQITSFLAETALDDDLAAIANNMQQKFGMDVKIVQENNEHLVIIKARDMEELDRLVGILG